LKAKTNTLIDNLTNTTNSKIQFIINEIKGINSNIFTYIKNDVASDLKLIIIYWLKIII